MPVYMSNKRTRECPLRLSPLPTSRLRPQAQRGDPQVQPPPPPSLPSADLAVFLLAAVACFSWSRGEAATPQSSTAAAPCELPLFATFEVEDISTKLMSSTWFWLLVVIYHGPDLQLVLLYLFFCCSTTSAFLSFRILEIQETAIFDCCNLLGIFFQWWRCSNERKKQTARHALFANFQFYLLF